MINIVIELLLFNSMTLSLSSYKGLAADGSTIVATNKRQEDKVMTDCIVGHSYKFGT